jgi:hypothetical protein
MWYALIESEQVPGREFYHLLWQMKPDVTAQSVHRDSRRRRVLMHAGLCLHGDQNNAKIGMLCERLGTSPRGLLPRVILVQLVELASQIKSEQGVCTEYLR